MLGIDTSHDFYTLMDGSEWSRHRSPQLVAPLFRAYLESVDARFDCIDLVARATLGIQ